MLGQTLGHYQIIEQIGAGGMGEVYRAHDLQLDRDVALKVLPSGTLSGESARKQFRKEALALARLNHPNIATVHEFGAQDGLDFIVMELIPGSTLGHQAAHGAMGDKELLRLGLQLADGLTAAHEHGIVHRDLKPGNLMTTPDGRLKILDFGLAQLAKGSHDIDLTQSDAAATGAVSGTLPYMSPEQLRGQPVDARSDIYAAGAVLYQLATGRRPFPQSQSSELIGAILHQSPDAPSAHGRRISHHLERVILKALEKDPSERYQTARELHDALEAAPIITEKENAGWRAGYAVASIALALLSVAAMLLNANVGGIRDRLWPGPAADGVESASPPVKVRQSVAVLGFKNVAGRADDAWLSTALSEMMTTELAAGEQLRTIPGENVARMKINLSLPDADSYGRETLDRIRRHLSADHVVLGSYIPLGDGQIRLDLRLQSTAAGETVVATSVKGDEMHIDDLVARAGSTLRDKLGVSDTSDAEAVAVRATLPRSRDAARRYATGLLSLRQFDYQGARDALEAAVSIEPDHALAHSALAVALKGLGYDQRASEEAKKAYDLSANFSREERLWIEGQYREATNRFDVAVDTYNTLFAFFPDNLDYGLRLAAAQTSAGKGRDALATAAKLRQLPPPASDDARIDYAEAAAAGSVGDYKTQQSLAAKTVSKADAQGARLLAAQGRVLECSALRYLGQPKESVSVCEEARTMFAAAGDRTGVARSLNAIAVVHMEQGDLAAAKKTYDESLAITRDVGDKKLEAMVLNNLAGALRGQVDLAGSRKALEQALANFREIGDKGGVVRSLDNIGIVLVDEGAPEAARKRYEESLVICREIGNKSLTGFTLYLLGETLIIQGDLAGAARVHREALAIREEIGDERAMAESRLALAAVAVETGAYADAESSARAQIAVFQKLGVKDKEALTTGVLLRALMGQRKLTEATQAVAQAETLVKTTQDTTVRLSVVIDAARVRAKSGAADDLRDARSTLRSAIADATKEGLTGLLLEARLALGQIDLESGDRGAAPRLAALGVDAGARGFSLIARKASASR